jgi:cation transport regulator ChaC
MESHKPRKLYFAYGSNLHRSQMRAEGADPALVARGRLNRCPDSVDVAPYVLKGFHLAFVGEWTERWGQGGVATVIPAAGSQVHGALYRISARDEAALDRAEGVAEGVYYKDELTLSYQDERVLMYVASAKLSPENKPGEAYLRTIRLGYEQWNLPVDVLDGIETHPEF